MAALIVTKVKCKVILYYYYSAFALIADDDAYVTPRIVQAKKGETVKFDRTSKGIPSWYFEKLRYFPKSASIRKFKLLILEEVTVQDSGNYFCHGLYKRKDENFLDKVQLKVYGNKCWSL